ncbi:MAG TPA: CaiB/BaiF CoA-transferase family protein [Mycobacteriales bacterium]|nr:CaiB/BaiF CoA-transferase family protein [Mycobacteriales bacterium]
MTAPAGPLAGLTVVALEQAVAAPLCTRQLADLGARVIKVETRGEGDSARYYDETVHGLAAHFVWLNRGKASITLDLKDERGIAVLHELIARADVVVQNLAPGAAARLGVGSAAITAKHPRLIAVDISGYGEGGPLSERRAYDLLVQSEAGSCSVTGKPGEPAKPGISVADIGTGMHAYSAVLAALIARASTGRGTVISVALFDVIAEWMTPFLHQARYGDLVLEPNGVGSPLLAPYGDYITSDGARIVVGTANDREWRRLATTMIERPDLAEDPRYRTNIDRVARRPELDAIISAWVGSHTEEEVHAAADRAGIGHARVNGVRDVLGHPQLSERDRWMSLPSPVGPIQALRPSAITDAWADPTGGLPGLGEQTDAILAELGRSAAQIDELRSANVV